MAEWGRGFYRGDQSSAVERVLAEMAEKARLREEQERQEHLQQQRMQHEAALGQRDIQAKILAAYMANPNEQTYGAAVQSGILGDMPLPQYQPTDQEVVHRDFWRGVRQSDPSTPLQVDPVRAGLLNPDLARAEPFMGIASQRYTYGHPDALPPSVVQAQRVEDKLDLSAPEVEERRQADRKFSAIELPESKATITLRGAQTRHSDASAGASTAQAGLYGAQTRLVGEQTANEALRRDPTSPLSRKPESPAKPSSSAEKRTMNFYLRAADAVKMLEQPYGDTGKSLDELVGMKGTAKQWWLNAAPNVMQPEENQLYQQAQRQFTEARLRKDSGAAIPEFEFANDRRMYFAQPGDSAAVIQRKQAARHNLLQALKMESGRAYGEFYGGDAGAPKTLTPEQEAGIAAAVSATGKSRDDVIAHLRAQGRL